MPKEIHTIEMKQGKVCKNSVRYETDDANAQVTNVYVNKTAFKEMPSSVTVTVTASK